MSKRLLVLGGGLLQVPLIKKAKEKGFTVFLSDYYEDPPGKKYCDRARQISTLALKDNCRYALEENIDCIMTIGTDQPVYTAAYVSARLGLKHPISEEQGRLVTNKGYMKSRMAEKGVPTPDFRVFERFEDINLKGLGPAVVMKPVDSQGQRGIFILDGTESEAGLRDYFNEAKRHSLTGSVIFEEFYAGEEITVNCWVKKGQAFVLMITDRLHFDDTVVLGICKQQRFPSKSARGHEEEIQAIVQRLADAFQIADGPLYIQMIVGKEGVRVIEFGYRIGGGFESEIIPRVTGIDILELYFTLVSEGINKFEPEKLRNKVKMGSAFFMLAEPGTVKKIKAPVEFEKYGQLFIQPGQVVGRIENATSRAGYFAFYTDTAEEYYRLLDKFDAELAIINEDGRDILIHNLWE